VASVIFDCDGVLVDSEPLAARAMSDVLTRAGLVISPEELMGFCVGLSQKDILAAVAARLDRVVPENVSAELWPATRALFAAELGAMPGVAEVLQALDVPVGVASSSPPQRIEFSLARAGLRERFGRFVFSSAMVPRGKPFPDLFLHAAREMAVAPADCVVVEDSTAGTTAARAAGMRVLGFVGGSHAGEETARRLRAAGAEAVAADWTEGLPALRRILAALSRAQERADVR